MMKVVFLNILMVSVAVMSYAQSSVVNVASGDSVDVECVRVAVDAMMRDYPEATLQDVYKSCFQDYRMKLFQVPLYCHAPKVLHNICLNLSLLVC